MSVQYWRNGAPTISAIEAFTEGDCWILAITLHRMTGWPVYLLDHHCHWVVRAPGRDRYLDITGVRTRKNLLNAWDSRSLTRADRSPFWCYAQDDVFEGEISQFPDSHRRARVVAQRLLERCADLELVEFATWSA